MWQQWICFRCGKPESLYTQGMKKDENMETEMGSLLLQGCTEIIRKLSVLDVLHQYVDGIGYPKRPYLISVTLQAFKKQTTCVDAV